MPRVNAKPALCQVCDKDPPKYKCPKCEIHYCSLGCYKAHKDTCTPVAKPPAPDPAALASAAGAVETDATRTTRGNDLDRLNAGTLLKLGEDDRMIRLLKNKPLRDLLREVDSSPDPEMAMRAAMDLPIFIEFVDHCLMLNGDIADPKRAAADGAAADAKHFATGPI